MREQQNDQRYFKPENTIKNKNMIKETKIQINNYSNYKKLYSFRNSKGAAPQTMVLAFCMYAAGIKKISTSDEMKELILRTILIFRETNIYENFLSNDYLIRFDYKGRDIRLVPDDFRNHAGMQLVDFKNETPSLDEWMKKTGKERRKLKQKAALWLFTRSAILPDKAQDEDQGYTWLDISPSEEYNEILNAGILADCIINDIGQKEFEASQDQNIEKPSKDKKDKKVTNEPPFFFDCWRRSYPIEILELDRKSPMAETDDLPSIINQTQVIKDVYIPWPFQEGTARQRECHRIDPSWN